MLVALKVMSISAHLTDHVLQTGVACKHAVGTLDREVKFRAEVRQTEIGFQLKCMMQRSD